MGKTVLRLMLACLLMAPVSCSKNILAEMGGKTSDAALLETARRKISDQSYDDAVAACESMSADYLTDREPLYVCAAAFAGRCGLNLLDFVASLDGYTTSPSGNVIPFLMSLNHGATTADIDDCSIAEDLLQAIGPAADRTGDENALMTLVALHRLGVVANVYADTDDDDTVDAGYNTCTDVASPYDESITSALWEIYKSAGASHIPGGSDLVTAIGAACTAIDLADTTKNFCTATDPDAFTANQVKGALGLAREDAVSFGLGDCAGNVVTCICP